MRTCALPKNIDQSVKLSPSPIEALGLYSPTILKNVLCLFPNDL